MHCESRNHKAKIKEVQTNQTWFILILISGSENYYKWTNWSPEPTKRKRTNQSVIFHLLDFRHRYDLSSWSSNFGFYTCVVLYMLHRNLLMASVNRGWYLTPCNIISNACFSENIKHRWATVQIDMGWIPRRTHVVEPITWNSPHTSKTLHNSCTYARVIFQNHNCLTQGAWIGVGQLKPLVIRNCQKLPPWRLTQVWAHA
jgi:hypothetical protein